MVLLLIFVLMWIVCVHLRECALHTAKASEKEMRGCSVPTGRWSLSLSLEVFHFTPHYTRLFPSACCLSFTALQHPHHLLSSFCVLRCSLYLSVCLVGDMSSVRCNPSWQICSGMCVGVKPVKWCVLLHTYTNTDTSLSLSWWLSVLVKLMLFCLEANRHSVVSKGLLGWNSLSKDTWQFFTASWDRTSTDPHYCTSCAAE